MAEQAGEQLPKFVYRRGRKFRVVFSANLYPPRYWATYDTQQLAAAARRPALQSLGYTDAQVDHILGERPARLGNEPPAAEPPVTGSDPDTDAADGSASDDAGARLSWSEQGNHAEASSRWTGRVRTLEELLQACQVDLDVWQVERHVVNTWEMGARNRDQDLTWTAGVMDGHSSEHGLTLQTLYQVKAWLVRRKPVALHPVIHPVAIACRYETPALSLQSGAIGRALVIADPHAGFMRDMRTGRLTPLHDRRVLDLALQIAQLTRPDRVDWIGDVLDMSEWTSKVLREPAYYWCTQPAIEEIHWWLGQFRVALPGAAIRIYEGNHEARLRKALLEHLPAACELKAADELDLPPALSLPRLLALHALGIEWVGDHPDELDWVNDGLGLCHGDYTSTVPGATSRKFLDEMGATVIYAHQHRRESAAATLTTPRGQVTVEAMCPGCACHVDGRVPGAKGRQNWQQGIATIDYEAGGAWKDAHLIPIADGRTIWDRSWLCARDRMDALRAALPDWPWAGWT